MRWARRHWNGDARLWWWWLWWRKPMTIERSKTYQRYANQLWSTLVATRWKKQLHSSGKRKGQTSKTSSSVLQKRRITGWRKNSRRSGKRQKLGDEVYVKTKNGKMNSQAKEGHLKWNLLTDFQKYFELKLCPKLLQIFVVGRSVSTSSLLRQWHLRSSVAVGGQGRRIGVVVVGTKIGEFSN